ncbi:D-cysteine desulfhydrase family protein [Pseudomonas entomophila]|uniref:D-cysteine desulfhydrase family protein n=1 Tax=Pseudomonas entomophila TaxID=312306 RepID=UPI0023D878B6|nr:D-cysteine desulfhydrase family protein [Pseudomonas entomophila]MDF0729450.1 D-cysteine desulfhydrase family protein [Pseudomonas entomophila]
MAPLHALLARFPQTTLIDQHTPIQRLTALEHVLGLDSRGIRLFAKRDDFMALGGGGNKLRKLEFLLGAALHDGVERVITVGGLQSNHARLSAAACASLGMPCELVLSRAVAKDGEEYEQNGNVLLDRLFGANLHIAPDGISALHWAEVLAAQRAVAGEKVRVIPTGGSTALGCLGYAKAALEIIEQEHSLGMQFTRVFTANGSSGTHAGLAAGFAALGRGAGLVKSYAVLANADQARQQTLALAHQAQALLGLPDDIEAGDIDIDASQLGDGYGLPTDSMLAALRLMARAQGLLLDPVYSGKAFAGLLADLEGDRYQAGDNLLFVMTGGTPGLFAYRCALSTAPPL